MRRIFVIMLPAGVGVWLGAMVFFSFAVAPTAFATLESRHQAGDLVAATLNILYLFGYVLGPLLVLASVVARPIGRQRLWGLRTILLVLMTLSTLISREFVGTKLLALRRAMGPMIEKTPPWRSIAAPVSTVASILRLAHAIQHRRRRRRPSSALA